MNKEDIFVEDQGNTLDKQIEAIQGIRAVFAPLQGDRAAVHAVLIWANAAYGVPVGAGYAGGKASNLTGPDARHDSAFEDLPDLFSAAEPPSEADRVLVAAYWLQKVQGQLNMDGQAVNTALKNLGYPVGNITNVFSGLMKRKPALAMQVLKSGTTKQARKKYKLTHAGIQHVESMISGAEALQD